MFHVVLGLIGLIGVFIALFMLYLVLKDIVTYIFESIFLFIVSKKENYKYPGLGFVPAINKYYLGRIADRKVVGIISAIVQGLIIGWWIFAFVAPSDLDKTSLEILLLVLLFANFILCLYLSHVIMKKVTGNYAILLTLLNIFTCGLSRGIILFIIRNKLNKEPSVEIVEN